MEVLSLFIGFMFIFGYTWIAKTDDVDYVDDSHVNLLQTRKVDTDGETPMVGTFQEDKGTDVTAATNITLGTDGNYYVITGNTAIVSIIHAQAQPGTAIRLKFSVTPIVTHSATDLILPGGANITMAAGNVMELVNIDTNKWRCTNILKADGTPLSLVLTETLQEDVGTPIASADPLVPGADGNFFHVTGVTNFTAINAAKSQPGTAITLVFDGILTITHHATDLILPGGANITTAAGDRAIFREESANKWNCIVYIKADGTPIVGGGGKIGQVQIDINTTTSTKATGFPNDDTKPQIGEGDEILTKAFTPINAGSTLLFYVAANIHRSTGAFNLLALFVVGTNDCLISAAAESSSQGLIIHSVAAATTNVRTYTVKVGSDTGNNCIVNDVIAGGVSKMGASQESRLVIIEVLP